MQLHEAHDVRRQINLTDLCDVERRGALMMVPT
jgi:hypothetical protein